MAMFWKYVVVVLASVVQSLGLTLQRASHVDNAAAVDVGTRPRQRVGLWRLGILLFISANIFGSSVQLAVLPLALVCTLQASGLVANAAFAVLILHEPFTRVAMAGTVLVVAGAVMVAGLGNFGPDPSLPLKKLLKLFWAPHFLMWMSLTLAVGITCLTLALRLERTRAAQTRMRIGALYGILGGIASAHSLLMAKLAIGLLVRDIRQLLTDLLDLRFYAIVLLFLTFALSQMWFVSRGLEHASTSILYPLVFCVYNLCTMTNSAVFYGASRRMHGAQVVYVCAGTLVLITGVLLLSTRLEDHSGENLPTTNVHLEEFAPRAAPTLSLEQTVQADLSLYSDAAVAPVSLSVQPEEDVPTTGNNEADVSYTSFDTLSPKIASPNRTRSKFSRMRLSKEQSEILRELCM